MNVLSLFSGIGAFEHGLEAAGMTTVGQVELDGFCRSILAKRWPGVARHDDVRTAAQWWTSQPRPRVDVVCGGFPCTDLAPVGRRAGIEGEHSGLWTYFAEVVRAVRPRYVLVENSTGLLVRGMGRVVGDLAGLGYDAQWDCIPAAAVGAPHLRARLWILAYPCGVRDEAVDAVRAGWPVPGVRSGWDAEPAVGRVVDGPAERLVQPELHALGNSLVPQVAEHIGRLIVASDLAVAA